MLRGQLSRRVLSVSPAAKKERRLQVPPRSASRGAGKTKRSLGTSCEADLPRQLDSEGGKSGPPISIPVIYNASHHRPTTRPAKGTRRRESEEKNLLPALSSPETRNACFASSASRAHDGISN